MVYCHITQTCILTKEIEHISQSYAHRVFNATKVITGIFPWTTGDHLPVLQCIVSAGSADSDLCP